MSSGSRLCGWGVAFTSAAAVLLIVSAVFAQTTRPSAVERALKYAPEGTVGLVHYEVKSLAKDLSAQLLKRLEPNIPLEPLIRELIALAEKIDAIDMFLVSDKNGAMAPVVVIYGMIAEQDVNRVLQSFLGRRDDALLSKTGDGRYAQKGSGLLLVIGGEASELPAGVAFVGQASTLTPAFLAGLGKGRNEDLVNRLKDVDTAAPAWLAVILDRAGPAGNLPKWTAGAWYLTGGGQSRQVLEFEDANAAQRCAAGIQDTSRYLGPILSELDIKAEGTSVVISAKTTGSLVPSIVSAVMQSLAESRRVANRAISAANLKMLSLGCMSYAAANKAQSPPDLITIARSLLPSDPKTKITEEAARALVSPATGKNPNILDSGELGFVPDYVYVFYPGPAVDVPRPQTKVMLYERPENYKNEGTLVAYVDGHVAWVKMDEFTKQLKASQDWIAAHEKTATTREAGKP